MNLKNIVQLGVDAWANKEDGGYFSDSKMEQYAEEELGLKGYDIEEWMDKAREEPPSEADSDRFYIWYYINHVLIPLLDDSSKKIREAYEKLGGLEALGHYESNLFLEQADEADEITKAFNPTT